MSGEESVVEEGVVEEGVVEEGVAVVEVEEVTNPESLPYDSNSFFFNTFVSEWEWEEVAAADEESGK